ncbi:MAG: hypothetical protein A3G18_03930 [Rhodospirillales bacterium RIFCSPLOWO2_12_FULL_58_28]|nr:MAG: hypothetical protein A3H92_04810 [Rhodospirillales bacterium RIFCSPLOWO2_02_FULL_58_16]OHC78677.1 MAG: hypothetical protein A3G18_03930 [Rhodospirillales bacterium RIFCSPLOWO2_12_FULL_58_28]
MPVFKIALVALFLAVMAHPASADDGALTPGQKQAVKDVVREYLRDNPEVLVDAIRALQTKQEAKDSERAKANLSSIRGELENDPSSPVAGNPKGDITIVEFFDYRCGFCKKALPTVLELLKADGNIRYVLREYPILGEESRIAAQAALAAWGIDKEKYMSFHAALMSSKGSLGESRIFTIAAESGVDVAKLRVAMKDASIEKMLKRNYELAETLGISGTPAFIIGNNVSPGFMSLEAMQKAVAEARKG